MPKSPKKPRHKRATPPRPSRKDPAQKKGPRAALKQSLTFLCAWAAVFVIGYLAVQLVIGSAFFEGLAAHSAVAMLNATGQHASVSVTDGNHFILVGGKTIWVSELCSGVIETLIVAAAVLASIGFSRKKRLWGAVGAVAFGLGFNAVRVYASTMQILSTDITFAELTHDVLFRISILVVIALYYYWWMGWARKTPSAQV